MKYITKIKSYIKKGYIPEGWYEELYDFLERTFEVGSKRGEEDIFIFDEYLFGYSLGEYLMYSRAEKKEFINKFIYIECIFLTIDEASSASPNEVYASVSDIKKSIFTSVRIDDVPSSYIEYYPYEKVGNDATLEMFKYFTDKNSTKIHVMDSIENHHEGTFNRIVTDYNVTAKLYLKEDIKKYNCCIINDEWYPEGFYLIQDNRHLDIGFLTKDYLLYIIDMNVNDLLDHEIIGIIISK